MQIAAFARLGGLLRARGLVGLTGFLATRVARVRRHVLFLEPAVDPGPVDWQEDETVLIVRTAAELESLEQRVGALPAELRPYRDGVARGEAAGCLVLVGETLAHWSFLMYRSRMLCLLGAPEGAVLLGNAYTVPAFRGRGLQTRSLRARRRLAADSSAAWVVVETAPENTASRRALVRAGIAEMGELTVLVLLNHLAVRWGAAARREGRAWTVCR